MTKLYTKREFDKVTKLNKLTGTRYDENGYDINGFTKGGEHLKTKGFYDKSGFNINGYDKNGFNKKGIHIKTREIYNEEGYDKNSYDRNGFDKNGFNKNGIHVKTRKVYNEEGYDKNSYDRNGFDKNGFTKGGIHAKTLKLYNENGYDKNGYDENGFNKEGIHIKTKSKYDLRGYDKNGYDENGLNRIELIKARHSKKSNLDTESSNKEEKYNKFEINQNSKDGYDKYGFDSLGFHRITKSLYDEKGYNQSGFNRNGKKREEVLEKNKLQENSVFTSSEEEFENLVENSILNLDISLTPQTKKNSKITSGVKQWPRDPSVSKTAIYLANYKCQYSEEHTTFTSKTTNQQYMEAHHLIPMNAQDIFENSLDVLGNIISLCPICHRMIHHGDEESKNKIIEKLFMEKEKDLKKSGLDITLEKLQNLYK